MRLDPEFVDSFGSAYETFPGGFFRWSHHITLRKL